MGELEELRLETRTFAEARDWGPFHTPKKPRDVGRGRSRRIRR